MAEISKEQLLSAFAGLEDDDVISFTPDNESVNDFDDMTNINLPDPQLVNFWRDRARRTIWIDTEITEDIVGIVRWIIKWNEEDRGLPIDKRKPIKLFFNSPGGLLIPTIAVCDAIMMSKTPVYGYNMNECCSAASLIYCCCTKRYALPNAYFLLHLGQGGYSGTYQQTRAAQADYNARIKTMLNIYHRNLHFPIPEEFEKLIDGEWYLYSSDTDIESCHNARRYNLITDEWTSFFED